MTIPPQSILCGLLCLVAFHIRRGRCLLILAKGYTRTSNQRISKSKVPRFFFYTHGQSGANFPQQLQAMKKQYIAPTLSAIEVETGILCVSGPRPIAPKGNLESIGKSNGTW